MTPAPGRPDQAVLALALVVFFTSGVAALLYQVVWQRLLVIFSGADLYATTIIVAAFMAGLGAGSLAGGHVADRVSRHTALLLFGVAEVAIAAFGLASKPLYYDFLYGTHGHLATSPVVLAVVLLASLLWPTAFMGMSLPLLARALTTRIGAAASTIGALYGCNTIGAAAGALVSTWVLLPRLGLENSLQAAVTLNLLCAAAILPLLLRRGDPTIHARAAPAGRPAAIHGRGHAAVGLSFPQWLALYGLSGFIALSLEIVWFRVLGVMLKSTAFTFGTLLAVYLGGLGAGALAGIWRVGRSRRPVRTFLALQAAIPIYAGAFVALVLALLAFPTLPSLRSHLAANEPVDVYAAIRDLQAMVTGDLPVAERLALLPRNFLGLYVLLPIAMVGPPTFLMGASFPYLQKATQIDLAVIGRRVGALQVANIVGSMLGATVTGWASLTYLGTAATLKLLAALSGVFLVLLARAAMPTRRAALAGPAAAVVVVALIALVMPGARDLWAVLHGTTPNRVITAEDGSGLSLLKGARPGFGGQTLVFVNGLSQSWLPYGNIHTELGALPLMMHPAPRDIAVIGLGSGDTVFSLMGRPEVRSVTCIEIVSGQLATLERLYALQPYRALGALLRDPRVRHVVGDGRAHLAQSGRRFDIIEADALRPSSAYSGNLYSLEYFSMLRRHLEPGGYAVSWAPTDRVRDTFVRAFPHVAHAGAILIGSDAPIVFDEGAIAARLAQPEVIEHFALAEVDIGGLLAPYLRNPPRIYGPGDARAPLADLNTDLFPRDEFSLPF